MLLTQIVEQVSGIPFSEFAQKRLFAPLGMHHTFINDDATAIIPKRVTPYNYRTSEYIEGYAEYGVTVKPTGAYIQHPRNSPHYGGSGVVTTIDDLLKWSENMISKKFGGAEFYALMHLTLSFEHGRNNQAFGLYFSEFEGYKTVAWEGGDWGISSQLIRFPDLELAVVVLSNLGSGASYKKANAISSILLEETHLGDESKMMRGK